MNPQLTACPDCDLQQSILSGGAAHCARNIAEEIRVIKISKILKVMLVQLMMKL